MDKTPAEVAAEEWLRARYGAYRGHFAWRELEEAFIAGTDSARPQIEREARAVAVEEAAKLIEDTESGENGKIWRGVSDCIASVRELAAAPAGMAVVPVDFLEKLSTYHPTERTCAFGVHGVAGFFDTATEALEAYKAARPTK